MSDISVFINASGERSEHHDLSKQAAMDLGLKALWTKEWKLIPDVTVEIRDSNGIIYNAVNPPIIDETEKKGELINFS
jgi:hypothetical protein